MLDTRAGAAELTPEVTAEREAFFATIAPDNLAPLWRVLHGIVTAEPVTPVVPHHWSYAALRPKLMATGTLITAKEAERRVLLLENPGLPGQSAITRTLFAGFQLIMPGEVAPSHRHTQSALRFIIEGEGAYTSVDGERTTMYPGDFIITPSWTWHDHGNPTSQPMVWLDGLDIPLVRSLDASFRENSDTDEQIIVRPEGDAQARFGTGLLPVDWKPSRPTSPIFNYPYARTREALYAMSRGSEPDACHGYKLRYANPATGDHAMPTIATFMQFLPKTFGTSRYRASASHVYFVVEGTGKSRVGDKLFRWAPRDVFVVPPWTYFSHEPDGEAVLFSYSDRAVHEKLGLFREDRGNA